MVYRRPCGATDVWRHTVLVATAEVRRRIQDNSRQFNDTRRDTDTDNVLCTGNVGPGGGEAEPEGKARASRRGRRRQSRGRQHTDPTPHAPCTLWHRQSTIAPNSSPSHVFFRNCYGVDNASTTGRALTTMMRSFRQGCARSFTVFRPYYASRYGAE